MGTELMHRTRITRTNGSLSIEIPEDMLATLGLHEGDEVGVGSTEKGIVLVRIGHNEELPNGIDSEFAARVDAFIDKYQDALNSLAKR